MIGGPVTGDLERAVEHGFVTSGEVRIHYAAMGRGPLMVMIHGFPDFWYTWRRQMPSLAANHRVVAIDLRGYNLSDKPKGAEHYDMLLLMADVESIIHHFGAERAIIAGHDWGGAIAWALGMNRPARVRELVILNLPHPACIVRELGRNPQQHAASAYARAFQGEAAHLELTAEKLCEMVGDPTSRSAYLEAFHRSDLEAMLNYYKRNYPRPPYDEAAWMSAKVTAPTLMIHGLRDPYLLPGALDGTWERVDADLSLMTVPDAGHWVHHDAADLVTRTICAWLAR